MNPRSQTIARIAGVAFLIGQSALAATPTPSPSASPTASSSPSKDEWVIYATEVGWLRVGPRPEYEAKWAKKDEINGGTSDERLKKILLAPGFESRDAALKYICDHLTKVQLRIAPPAAGGPVRYLTGVLRGKEYSLRLTKGFDEESGAAMAKTGKFYKALEYDWESEWDALKPYNLTPRYVFPQREWLIHVTGHGSVNGPVKEDRWMCSTSKPYQNEKKEYSVTLADGMGGTIGYSIKEVEGPFLDNYTMATAMKKYKVDKVDLWPPVTSAVGRDVQPGVDASKIPADPKDYGDAVLETQPLLPDKRLEDWVIYSVEDQWLHCGTRYEFKLPRKKNQVSWAGNSEEPAKKTIIAPVEGAKELFKSRKQALRALVGELTEISSSYNPTNEPRETITAKYRGQSFHLRIDRGENGDFVVEGPSWMGYDYAGNVASLREIDPNITPRKRFNKQWVVHATGHGTMDGGVKDDRWMTLNTPPDEGKHTFLLPDGMGGTFGYSYDKGGGPFIDSYQLIAFLKQIKDPNVKTVGIYAEDRSVSIDDIPDGIKPTDSGSPTQPPAITLKKIAADSAMQGETLGVFILGSKIETGCRASLGTGITVKNMTYFGRAPNDPNLDQWIGTVEIDDTAPIGKRTLTVYNGTSSYGTLPNAFEVKERLSDLCPPLETIAPANANPWIFKQTSEDPASGIADAQEKQKAIAQIQERRSRLQDDLIKCNDAKEQLQIRWGDLEKLVAQIRDTDSDKEFDKNVKLLKKRAEAEKQVRKIETEYFKAVSPLIEAFSDAELGQLTDSLQRRSECLFKHAAAALDDARRFNYTVSWEAFGQKKLIYDIHQENLVHTLNGFQTLNSMRLLETQRRLSVERSRILRTDPGGLNKNVKTLQPLQRRLRDVYLDMGQVSLMLAQAQAEAAMLDQESYFAGVQGVTKQAKNTELAESFKAQSSQAVIFSMKYLLAGGMSVLGAGVDSIKRWVNWVSDGVAATTVFDTLSSDVAKQIKEGREKTEVALKTLNRIRGYDDKRSGELNTIFDEGTKALNANRVFHEQTSGGLRRMAACYITDIPQLMDQELQIAHEHAELVAADMKKAFDAKVGVNAKGDIPYKKLLTDPIGTMKTAIQDTKWGGDHFTPTAEYIARRKGQLQEIDTVRQALERTNFNPLMLQRKLPKLYAFYLALEEDNPDFLQWSLTRDRLAAQQRLDKIDAELNNTFEPDRRLELQQMAARNRNLMMRQAAEKQAHYYQLQGADKMMVWDYDGGLECFYQAAEWNPRIQPLDRVEALRKELAWQKTVEAGIEVSTQVGNMGIQAALFEFLGQSVGAITHSITGDASLWTQSLHTEETFAQFVWKQFNPLHELTEGGVIKGEWSAIDKAGLNLAKSITIQLVQKDMVQKGILQGYFGVDESWADFLANAFISTAQVKLASGKSVIGDLADWVKTVNEKFDFRIVDIPLWNERQEARRSLADFCQYETWVRDNKDAREKISGKKLETESESQIKTETQALADSQANLEKNLGPIEKDDLHDLYDALFPPQVTDAAERLNRIREFFKGLNWKEHIMKLHKTTVNGKEVRTVLPKKDPFGVQIDNLRRELLASSQVEFFNDPRFAKYKQYIVDFLYIGSAGKKDSDAYKKTGSDIDFTLLVKAGVAVTEDTPEQVRNELREDFMKFFQEFSGGKELEAFEMSIMVDSMPKFYRTGESTAGISSMILGEGNAQKRAQNRAELLAGIKKTIEQLISNASDKERYLDRGNLFRHNLFVRLGCFLKKAAVQRGAEGAELVDEPATKYDELYGDVPLEPWMAFDAVMGNLGYITQHSEKYSRDSVEYQKELAGKYAIRGALYSMLMMSPRGRERMRTLTRAEVERNGWDGAERIMVEIAKEIASNVKKPGDPNSFDGVKELGLPTAVDIPGQNKRRQMTANDWLGLFEEWSLRKEGVPLHEIFSKTREGGPFDKDHPAVAMHMKDNIMLTEAAFKAATRKTIVDQGTELMQLKNARKDALSIGDTEAAEIFELKMKEILLSQAAVWNRMSRDQQNMVLKEAPPEADWWMAIAEVEGLKEQAGAAPAPTKENPERVVLDPTRTAGWQPRILKDENADELSRRAVSLQERAKNSPPSKVCNAAAELSVR
jgi:hypothetical protein